MVASSSLDDVFATVLEKGSPEEQSAYLDEACRDDPALRKQVERMLSAHAKAGSFLESPAPEIDATFAHPSAERPGDTIGRYKLLEEIGDGGMGVVYMAEQREPVRRKVALKIIKPGMDTREVIARFEAERQALAMMDHPNIAKVFDAGETESGRPYFVMELVDGCRLTDYCDFNELTIRRRLELFVQVCQAVHHAHQKGIIHRDIKPSNVMVALYDRMPVPKIIDFGIAKAIHAPLTERTFFTHFGQMIGTPLYMSPEQAELRDGDVDTRSDIYSLGVMLYELLTGTTPFDEERAKKAGYDEIRRMIREDEPQPPSTRVSTMKAADTAVFAHRKTDPARLGGVLRRDLDWIVMKALEKDRARRYDTASDLARDVERYLQDEPVEARPRALFDRAAKWARRHRPLVGLTVVLLVFSTIALALSTLLIAREHSHTVEAYREKDQQLTATQKAERLAKQQEGLAKQQAALAKEQQQLAHDEEREAVRQRDISDRNLYVADMRLAQHDWEQGQVSRLHEMLDSHMPRPNRPDLRSWEWYYYLALCHSDLITLRGDTDEVSSVAWSPDGKWLASAGGDGTLTIWNAASGKKIRTLTGHHGAIYSIAWSPDSNRLASGGWDGTARAWDAVKGNGRVLLRRDRARVCSVAWSPNGSRLAVGGIDRSGFCKILDVTNGREILNLAEARCPVAWSPDGKRLASGGVGHWDFKTWDAVNGKMLLSVDASAWAVQAFSWSPDGKRLVTAQVPNGARIWDTATGREIRCLGHGENLSDAVWSPDGKRIATASWGERVTVWDAASGEQIATLQGHRDAATSVAWSPDNKRLASGGGDGTIKIWDACLKPGARVVDRAGAGSIECSPKSDRLASSGAGKVTIWNLKTGAELKSFNISAASCAWNPDGKRLALIGGPTVILDVETGKSITVPSVSDFQSTSWSPDGNRLAFAQWHAQSVGIVEASKWQVLVLRHGAGEKGATSIAWSPDGSRVASGARGVVTIWDAVTGTDRFTLRGHHEGALVRCVAWSPDGKRLAAGSDSENVNIWDATTGRELLNLVGHTGSVVSLGWSADGKRLASASTDGLIKIWDPTTGQDLMSLPGNGAAWSRDGQRLATVGDPGGTIRVYDASTGYARANTPELLADAHEASAARYSMSGDLDRALGEYDLATNARADSTAFNRRGRLNLKKQEFKKAAADFSEVVRLEPTLVTGYVSRAEAYAEAGDFDRAAADLSKAIELTPDEPLLWYWRCLAELAAGRLEKYRNDCAQVFHRFGHSADVGEAFDASWVCTLGPDAVVDWSPVVAAAKRASKEDSTSVPCMVGRGAVLYRSGCFSQAVQLLTQADQLLRDHPSPSSPVYAWLYLAMAEHNLGHREEARRWLDKAVQWMEAEGKRRQVHAEPGDTWDRRLALRLLCREADAMLKTEPRLKESPPAERANMFYARGLAHKEKGERSGALAAYSDAIRLDPTVAEYHLRRGEAYAEQGDYDRALSDLTEAARLDPLEAEVWVNRGSIYFDRGVREKAEADFNEALRIDPACAEKFFARGEAFAKANQPDRALAEYRKAFRLDPQPQYTAAYLQRMNVADKRDLEQILADFRQPLRVRAKADSAWLHLVSCWLPFVSRGTEKRSGYVWVSDMPWVRSTCGYRCPEATRDGHLGHAGLSIAGFLNVKGVMNHAFADATPADVVLDISGLKFSVFKASATLLDRGSVQFQVLIDGKVQHQTEVMHYGDVDPISLDVTAAKEIVLRVLNDGGNGNGNDSVAWGFARFIQAGAEDPLEKPPATLHSAIDANAALFLAEVHWRLDHKELSRRWFEKAAEWMDKNQAATLKLRPDRVETGKLLGISETRRPTSGGH